MKERLWVVQTTLPGDWLDPVVGEWAHNLVNTGPAVCVHISRVVSMYKDEGNTISSEEWRLQIKTSIRKKKELIQLIKKNHPYDIPQILFWEVHANMEYLEWAY
jgi:periplasmic divalent cation tolerance protein